MFLVIIELNKIIVYTANEPKFASFFVLFENEATLGRE